MRVLIAVDETPESLYAARCAHRLFGDQATYLIASIGEPSSHLLAIDPFGAVALDVHTITQPSKEHCAYTATRVAEQAGLLEAEIVTQIGRAGPALCDLASELNADALVVGDHDRGFLSRLIDPSVKRYVIDHAPCPVVVARPDLCSEEETTNQAN